LLSKLEKNYFLLGGVEAPYAVCVSESSIFTPLNIIRSRPKFPSAGNPCILSGNNSKQKSKGICAILCLNVYLRKLYIHAFK
jgi:hypothetical protein